MNELWFVKFINLLSALKLEQFQFSTKLCF